MVLALMFTFGLIASSTSEVQKPAAVPIYVGPQVRDGFIDVDRGVLDSIDDVVRELRKDKRLRIVSAIPATAGLPHWTHGSGTSLRSSSAIRREEYNRIAP